MPDVAAHAASPWEALVDVLALLVSALVLGALCERLRQSAVIGYLLAGTLLGPNALKVVSDPGQVEGFAELGVAMLLFSIGLEFSWRRLRRLGSAALGGGTLQVVCTMSAAFAAALAFGLGGRPALAVGAMVALSSTACVLRLLAVRAELESVHGRSALGILLLQDLAVVPLLVMVSLLGNEGTPLEMLASVGRTVVAALGLIGGFYLLFNYVVPLALGAKAMRSNRELPILLAVASGVGSAWFAHQVGLSPALGAFLAGMLLAESPFAAQVRADVSSLRTLLLTLFFTSIGMLGNPGWIADHLLPVGTIIMAIVVGKAIIIWLLLRLFGQTHVSALTAGLCLAQVGEFSFVIAAIARGTLIDEDQFLLIVSATIGTLFLTPYLVAAAPRAAQAIIHLLQRMRLVGAGALPISIEGPPLRDHIIIIGFGPAGQSVGHTLLRYGDRVCIVDLNRAAIKAAEPLGFRAFVGDAAHAEVLEHLNVAAAAAVIVTVPDPTAARNVITLIKSIAPDAHVIARARYHVYRWELELAGAEVVIDEERQVGYQLAEHLRRVLPDET